MSLVYQRGTSRVWFWACAAVVSVGFHGGLSYLVLQDQPVEVAEQQVDAGITGAIMFDLSDLIAAPADMAEDSAKTVESAEAPTITESPEVVDPAKAADEPILSQIPYAVEDESLKFGVASPIRSRRRKIWRTRSPRNTIRKMSTRPAPPVRRRAARPMLRLRPLLPRRPRIPARRPARD
jgi:hypothetical protein